VEFREFTAVSHKGSGMEFYEQLIFQSVWQSQKRASNRSVARAMSAAGFDLHFVTIGRWKRHG
jgi:hypothetical protein